MCIYIYMYTCILLEQWINILFDYFDLETPPAPQPGVVRCRRWPAAAGRAQPALRGRLALQRCRSGGAGLERWVKTEMNGWKMLEKEM